MKKLLLSLMACAGFGFAANAQLPVGSVAPDFTLTDINGQSHHLYAYLDSGYAVIIDVSATWCGPCWSAHTSHVFENLTDHYGPNGSITPKKVKVIFIEGDGSTTLADLNGTTSASQGNWVAGTNYPIIDNTSLNASYLYGGYPSFTIICRDRLVAATQAGYGSAMGVESWWLNYINADCPTTAPSATVDAKAVPYSGQDYFVCSAAPQVKFQNYSQSQSITAASIKVYSGATLLTTAPWTGSLAPYAVASVNVPSFTPTASQTGPYKFEVVVTGDSYAANNEQTDLFEIMNASNAAAPFAETFEATVNAKIKFPADEYCFVTAGTSSANIIGAGGVATKAVVFTFPDMNTNVATELFLGNYNTASLAHAAIDFDVSYAQKNAEADKLEVLVSTNCGQSWTPVYSKSGNTLKTHAPQTALYIPSAKADWRHEGVLLDAYKNDNMLVKMKATSMLGNYGFVDNIRVSNTTGVSEVITNGSVSMYPNPAKDNVTVAFSLTENSNVTIQIVDVTGRVVSTSEAKEMNAGTQKVSLSTAALSTGIYNVKIVTEKGAITERLSVVK